MNQLEIQFQSISPTGPFTIRKPVSVMTAYYVPRDHIKVAKSMKGINRYGIYCLYGDGRIYIGQTRNGIERIMEHTRGKQFWNEAVLFLADPIHFNLNIISGLERHAIEQAIENSPYEVENKSIPQYETISDSEKEQILTIYEEISFIMGFIGIRTEKSKRTEKTTSRSSLKDVKTTQLSAVSSQTQSPLADQLVFHTRRRGIKGLLSIIGGSYVVLSGSIIDLNTPLLDYNYSGTKKREDALNMGIIKKNDDGFFTLTQDVHFKSPSAAAEFVLGSSRNGKIEWVDDNNKPLGEYLAEASESKTGD